MMKKILLYSLFVLGLGACQSLRPENVEIVSLGIIPDDVVVTAEAGEGQAALIADRDYKVEVLSGADWLTVGAATRESIGFSYGENSGYRRCARIRIGADGREDVLLVKQEGPLQEEVLLSEHALTVPAAGQEVSLRVMSNLPCDYFVASASNEKAILRLHLQDNRLSFEVAPTTNRDKRNYTVSVSYTDGWGESVSDSIVIEQLAYDD